MAKISSVKIYGVQMVNGYFIDYPTSLIHVLVIKHHMAQYRMSRRQPLIFSLYDFFLFCELVYNCT